MPYACRSGVVAVVGAVFVLGSSQRHCVATVVSTFDVNAEGWTIVGDAATPAYLATGGNPGGYVRGSDFVGGQTWFFSAPAKFLGNVASAYDADLTFDLSQQISGAPSQYNDVDVVLVGGGLTLSFNTAVNPAFYPDWTSYIVPLRASAGWRVGGLGGVAASEMQLLAALTNLTALRIRGEYQSGSDTGSLDNVRLPTGIPGDTNDDGVVDLADLNNVLNNFGDTGDSPGDDNGDGVVDLEDLNRVLNNFGDVASTAALWVIPEPGSIAAGTVAAAACVRRRCRRR